VKVVVENEMEEKKGEQEQGPNLEVPLNLNVNNQPSNSTGIENNQQINQPQNSNPNNINNTRNNVIIEVDSKQEASRSSK
jgi:hypothetical protein